METILMSVKERRRLEVFSRVQLAGQLPIPATPPFPEQIIGHNTAHDGKTLCGRSSIGRAAKQNRPANPRPLSAATGGGLSPQGRRAPWRRAGPAAARARPHADRWRQSRRPSSALVLHSTVHQPSFHSLLQPFPTPADPSSSPSVSYSSRIQSKPRKPITA